MMDEVYRHWTRRLVFTVGVRTHADKHGAHWLIDAVASHQPDPAVRAEGFQVWRLRVGADKSAVLAMTDGNSDKPIVEQRIEFTDYPPEGCELYLVLDGGLGVLMMPDEY